MSKLLSCPTFPVTLSVVILTSSYTLAKSINIRQGGTPESSELLHIMFDAKHEMRRLRPSVSNTSQSQLIIIRNGCFSLIRFKA